MTEPNDHAYLTGQLTGGDFPSGVGQKFSRTGQVLPFGGNTFICHIDPAGPAHQALVAAQALLRAGAPTGAYAYLPPASLHMTVFEGVCEAHRDADRWPKNMDPALALNEVTGIFADNFAQLDLPTGFSITPVRVFAGLAVSVSGTTATDRAALQLTRDLLRQGTGLHKRDFADYQFHITLAYLLRWLTPEQARAMQDLSAQAHALLAASAPVIRLGPPEFCRFDDMHAFHPVKT